MTDRSGSALAGAVNQKSPTESLAPDPVREALVDRLREKSNLEVAKFINLALLMCGGISEQNAGFDTITSINDAGLEKISGIVAALRTGGDLPSGKEPVVSIKPMGLSGGRTDYFVSIKVGDREVTPHVFREEYKAAYHVALYDWLLNGAGEEPDVVEFGPSDWPARALPRVPDSSALAGPVAWQFRTSLSGQDQWTPWTDCEKWQFEKIRDGLRTGWRKAEDIQARALYLAPQPGRDAMIEECAKLCEDGGWVKYAEQHSPTKACAIAIRALASPVSRSDRECGS